MKKVIKILINQSFHGEKVIEVVRQVGVRREYLVPTKGGYVGLALTRSGQTLILSAFGHHLGQQNYGEVVTFSFEGVSNLTEKGKQIFIKRVKYLTASMQFIKIDQESKK